MLPAVELHTGNSSVKIALLAHVRILFWGGGGRGIHSDLLYYVSEEVCYFAINGL